MSLEDSLLGQEDPQGGQEDLGLIPRSKPHWRRGAQNSQGKKLQQKVNQKQSLAQDRLAHQSQSNSPAKTKALEAQSAKGSVGKLSEVHSSFQPLAGGLSKPPGAHSSVGGLIKIPGVQPSVGGLRKLPEVQSSAHSPNKLPIVQSSSGGRFNQLPQSLKKLHEVQPSSAGSLSKLEDLHKSLQDKILNRPEPPKPTRLETVEENSRSGSSSPEVNPRFKTEICRNFKEKGSCLYGDECQFAHGNEDIRDIGRQNKYKTKLCQKYWITGYCAYGPRCNFVHNEGPTNGSTAGGDKKISSVPASAVDDHVTSSRSGTPSLDLLVVPRHGSGRMGMYRREGSRVGEIMWYDMWKGVPVSTPRA